MAFSATRLSALAYANGFTLWHYATPDLADVVDQQGYFDDASGHLRLGDMILVNSDIEGQLVSGIVHVRSNDGQRVDVDDLSRVDSTNSR